MKALQTPRLSDDNVHYIIYQGNLTAAKRLAIVNQLREYLELEGKYAQAEADWIIDQCTKLAEFSYTISDSGMYSVKYDGGCSFRGKQYLRIHKFIEVEHESTRS